MLGKLTTECYQIVFEISLASMCKEVYSATVFELLSYRLRVMWPPYPGEIPLLRRKDILNSRYKPPSSVNI